MWCSSEKSVDLTVEWRYRNTILAFAALANFGQMSSRLVISPVVPNILRTFEISKTAVGLALTGMWAAYALSQFPSGVLTARFGERRVIIVALSLLTLGSISLSVAPSFAIFSLAALFLGAGTGLYFAAAANFLSKLFSRRGQAIGITTAAGSFAGLIAPVFGAYIGARYGWRSAVLFGAAIALPLVFLFSFRVEPTEPDRPDQPLRNQLDRSMLVGYLTNPSIIYTIVLAGVGTFTFQAVTSFFPTFLVEQQHLSTEQAGLAFGVVFLLSAMMQPITGRLSDWVGRDIVIAGSMVFVISGIVMIFNPLPGVGLPGAIGLFGMGLSWFPVVLSRFMDVLPDANRSTGFGLVRTVYMLFGALGSVVTGAVADSMGWEMAYSVVAGLIAVSLLLIVVNRTTRAGL
jgi:YNFM family putative membrane transporter